MANEKPKMELYQKVLYGFCLIAWVAAGVLIALDRVHILDLGVSPSIACMCLSGIFQDVSMWKARPKTYTLLIALHSFLLGVTLMDVIDRLLG